MSSRTNEGYRYRERLGDAARGETVLSYLAARYRHSSESKWREHIREGRVRLDGESVAEAVPLVEGAELTFERPPWVEPRAPTSFAVLYRDDDALAVAKPRGLAAMPGGGFLENTLLRAVTRYAPDASPLHRLGRGTSGITLFSRRVVARRFLTEAWKSGEVVRRYRALARGIVPWSERSITARIGRVPHGKLGSVWAACEHGKSARTDVLVLERRSEASLVEIAIETGRAHQIRIHLAACGHPLVGERLYPEGGVPHPNARVLPGEPGYLLHAHYLSFPRRSGDGRVSVACAPPPALRQGHA